MEIIWIIRLLIQKSEPQWKIKIKILKKKQTQTNYQLSVLITIIFDAHWLRQKPSGDNKHTAFDYAIGCNLVKWEWVRITAINVLPHIWQPPVALAHKAAWLLERTTTKAKWGWCWKVHMWLEANLLGLGQVQCRLPKQEAPVCVISPATS